MQTTQDIQSPGFGGAGLARALIYPLFGLLALTALPRHLTVNNSTNRKNL